MKMQLLTYERLYLPNAFHCVKYCFAMVYQQPFSIRVKLFYLRISKGKRYNTFNICCNSVAFQYILITEGKKITLSTNPGLFILPTFLQCCIFELPIYSSTKTAKV